MLRQLLRNILRRNADLSGNGELRPTFAELLKSAITHNRNGQYLEATHDYKSILKKLTSCPGSLQLLDTIMELSGDNTELVNLVEAAVKSDPDTPAFYLNCGEIYLALNEHESAIHCYKRALALDSTCARACNSLGNIYLESGKTDEAITCYEKAVQLDPNYAEAYYNHGYVYHRLGRLQEAITCYEKSIKLNPGLLAAHVNLGNIAHELKQATEAINHFEKALSINPDNPGVLNNLGIVYRDLNQYAKAIDYYTSAIAIDPDYENAHNNIGNALLCIGQFDKAIYHFEKALALNPDYVDARYNLGNAFLKSGLLQKAIHNYKQVLQIEPNHTEALNNLGYAYQDWGEPVQAINTYEYAIAGSNKFPKAWSNLLLCLNYRTDITPEEIYAVHKKWAQEYTSIITASIYDEKRKREIKQIHVGYVSADFRMHSAAFFISAVFEHCDRNKFENFVYYNSTERDEMTNRLRGMVEHWSDVADMDDDQLVSLIQRDNIDILVDLSGHTAGNRMMVFARKPAPVQVSYLGYPNTTGLTTIDYRITDRWADPPGVADEIYSEELIRLPDCFLCYTPPQECPSIMSPPALDTGRVTFASFNNTTKMNREVISIWAGILCALPEARLILKSRQLTDPALCDHIKTLFQESGVSQDRLELIGWLSSYTDHMNLYNRVDIALDTFPYNGTTTTCEALYMGVPVVTLSGNRHSARVGHSILTCIGLEDLITHTKTDYSSAAINLAKNMEQLQKLRTKLREMLKSSSLMNAACFTGNLEKLYKDIWQRWHNNHKNTIKVETTIHDGQGTVGQDRKLHIGGKEYHADWEIFNAIGGSQVDHVGNADDLSRFADETFSVIYASHVFEHFDYTGQLSAVLAEWRRVLEPGGKLYISVPDMDILCRFFLDKSLAINERFYIMRMIFGGHIDKYDYHLTGLNREFLEKYLAEAGFININVVDDFGIFNDTSKMEFKGARISINMTAMKPIVDFSDIQLKPAK